MEDAYILKLSPLTAPLPSRGEEDVGGWIRVWGE
jgi:hypothetical protein